MSSIYTSSGDTDGHTFDKKAFGSDLRRKLASHRDTFVIDEDDYVFVPSTGRTGGRSARRTKLVSAAALKLLLDYCESDWPNMSIVEYAAAVFHSRAPAEDEILFDLLPDVQERLSAERIGLGHIYSKP